MTITGTDGVEHTTTIAKAKAMKHGFKQFKRQADMLKGLSRADAQAYYNNHYRTGAFKRPQWQVMTKPIYDRMINFINTNHPTRKRFREVFTRGSKVGEDFGNKFIHFVAQDEDYKDKEAEWARELQAALSRADEWNKPEIAALRKVNAKNRNRALAARRRKFLKDNGYKKMQDFIDAVGDETYDEERNNWLRAVTQAEINALNAQKPKKSKKKKAVIVDDEPIDIIGNDDSMTV